MTENETKEFIRREIKYAISSILMGIDVSNQDNLRSTIKRVPTESPIKNTRSIQPFGLSSRAMPETECLIVPVNGDPTHLNMVGHFDKSKPTCEDGESMLYDAYGHVIYLSQSKMQFGSKTSANPMMLGDIVKKLFSDLLQLIIDHQHISSVPGYLSAPPFTATQFQLLKTSPVEDDKIISDKCFVEK